MAGFSSIRRRAAPAGTAVIVLALAGAAPIARAEVVAAGVERDASDRITLTWLSNGPVEIFSAASPQFDLSGARLLASGRRNGRFSIDAAEVPGRYFVVVDRNDHTRLNVAERVIPLQQGSNFRDIGGYRGAGGKHVRWGRIYRSAGQPMLTPDDVERVKALGISEVIDLRSTEERTLAPTKLLGLRYSAFGYSLASALSGADRRSFASKAEMYRLFPEAQVEQLKIVFGHLLRESSPIVYNCSAGQDRTGFVTAMILTVLGVPKETIIQDYYLSTTARHPAFELPKLSQRTVGHDPVGLWLMSAQAKSSFLQPEQLRDAQGPYLRGAFEEIDAKWGSVEAYLEKEVGVGPAEVQRLRALYLE